MTSAPALASRAPTPPLAPPLSALAQPQPLSTVVPRGEPEARPAAEPAVRNPEPQPQPAGQATGGIPTPLSVPTSCSARHSLPSRQETSRQFLAVSQATSVAPEPTSTDGTQGVQGRQELCQWVGASFVPGELLGAVLHKSAGTVERVEFLASVCAVRTIPRGNATMEKREVLKLGDLVWMYELGATPLVVVSICRSDSRSVPTLKLRLFGPNPQDASGESLAVVRIIEGSPRTAQLQVMARSRIRKWEQSCALRDWPANEITWFVPRTKAFYDPVIQSVKGHFTRTSQAGLNTDRAIVCPPMLQAAPTTPSPASTQESLREKWKRNLSRDHHRSHGPPQPAGVDSLLPGSQVQEKNTAVLPTSRWGGRHEAFECSNSVDRHKRPRRPSSLSTCCNRGGSLETGRGRAAIKVAVRSCPKWHGGLVQYHPSSPHPSSNQCPKRVPSFRPNLSAPSTCCRLIRPTRSCCLLLHLPPPPCRRSVWELFQK